MIIRLVVGRVVGESVGAVAVPVLAKEYEPIANLDRVAREPYDGERIVNERGAFDRLTAINIHVDVRRRMGWWRRRWW